MLNRIKTTHLLIEKNPSLQKVLAKGRDVFKGINRSDLGMICRCLPQSLQLADCRENDLLRLSVYLQSPKAQVSACHSVTMVRSKSRSHIHLPTDIWVHLSGGPSRACFCLLWRPWLQSACMVVEGIDGVVRRLLEPSYFTSRKKKKSSWDITGKVCSFQGEQKDNSFLDPSWTETGNTVSTIFKEECWQRTFLKIRSISLLFWVFILNFHMKLDMDEVVFGKAYPIVPRTQEYCM